MSLNRELVERFRALHKQKFNEVIVYETAEIKLQELTELVRALTRSQDRGKNEQAI